MADPERAVDQTLALTGPSTAIDAATGRATDAVRRGSPAALLRTWLLLVPSCLSLLSTIALLIAAVMLGVRLRAQQALIEEGNARLHDLQVRVEDLSKIVCVPH